jgi:hypothetical protein
MRSTSALKTIAGAALLTLALTTTTSAEPLPRSVQGAWHITRVLPTKNNTCWNAEQAQELVGTTLSYKESAMSWRGGEVPLEGISTRQVSGDKFRSENTGSDGVADFDQLGIHAKSVLEVDMQHEDMDITGSTTEVPGDSVLVAGPNRIIVSACGVYFEAVRGAGSVMRASVAAKRTSGR